MLLTHALFHTLPKPIILVFCVFLHTHTCLHWGWGIVLIKKFSRENQYNFVIALNLSYQIPLENNCFLLLQFLKLVSIYNSFCILNNQ